MRLTRYNSVILASSTTPHLTLLKLQTTINDINVKMQDNQKSNQTLREDNMELASKLKSLLEEYRTREEVCLAGDLEFEIIMSKSFIGDMNSI